MVSSILKKKVIAMGPDLIVIGGGSSGFAAALRATSMGKTVVMISDQRLPIGGTCLNVGCVPSKTLIRAAESNHRANNNPFDGIDSKSEVVNFKAIISQKKQLIDQLRQSKYKDVALKMSNFKLVEGKAMFVDKSTIEVNGDRISSDRIIIATGSRTAIPDVPGLNEIQHLTHIEAFELEALPKTLVVFGGGYIALEIAQMFSRLGSKVTVLQRSSHILSSEEEDVALELTNHLVSEGIQIITDVSLQSVSEESDGIHVELTGSTSQTIQAEKMIVATGVQGNSDTMGLEKIGVETDKRGFITVDEYLETTVKGIYAVGDINGNPLYVYTAARDGGLAVENAFLHSCCEKKEVDNMIVPWVVFTDPQVAGVGMDEKQARLSGIDFEVSKLPLSEIPRALAARDTCGFIKLIREKETKKLIGARIVAPEGSELLMHLALAIKTGRTTDDIASDLFPYLTLSEGIKLACLAFDMDIKELSCCATK